MRSNDLGQNKMEQQTQIPPPPQRKDEAPQKPNHATFPSLIWGEGIIFPSVLSRIVVAWKYLGKRERAHERHARGKETPSLLTCLPRVPRFFLRPLLPSACYVGLDCRYF